VDFPRCARCRVTVQVDQRVIFRRDGRVEHASCPEVACPVCGRSIAPGQPIRRDRDADEIMHGNCWIRRYRRALRAAPGSPPPAA